MTQLNINMTSSFERDLRRLMKVRHIKTKAEAVRVAIQETLEHTTSHLKPLDFSSWVGAATQVPINKKPRFKSDDDLWK